MQTGCLCACGSHWTTVYTGPSAQQCTHLTSCGSSASKYTSALVGWPAAAKSLASMICCAIAAPSIVPRDGAAIR